MVIHAINSAPLMHRSFFCTGRSERERAENMNPSYLCGFCKCLLKTFDSKGTPSIEYTVCVNGEGKEKKCPFVKSSLLKDYCSVLLYSVKKIYKENPPFCEHGNTSTLFLSRSKDSFNRAFFKCANRADDDPCRYFQWADQEPSKYTLSQNHARPGYVAQKPVLPSSPTKYKKKKELKFLPTIKRTTSIILPPDEELVAPKRKKGPKEFKANKKIKKEISPPQITVLQEGNNQDPGIPCTSQDIESIEQLFESAFD